MSNSYRMGPDETQTLPGSSRGERTLWLNLSGGGFRAAIFHYGCLRRLHELRLMDQVAGISATSGGAIVAALWAMHSRISGNGSRQEDAAWQAFERDLLGLVRRGAVAPTGLLVAALSCYFCAWLTDAIALHRRLRRLRRLYAPLVATGLTLHAALVRASPRRSASARCLDAGKPEPSVPEDTARSSGVRATLAGPVALVHDGSALLPWL